MQIFVSPVISNVTRSNRKTNGLSQYLSGQVALEEIIYSTNYRNLEIIFSGPYAPNPSELLEQGRFGRLIEETRKFMIIFD